MKTVDLRDAESDRAGLVERAAGGEPFVIVRAGRPLVRAAPAEAPAALTRRRIGLLKGRISVRADSGTMGREAVIRMFEGD